MDREVRNRLYRLALESKESLRRAERLAERRVQDEQWWDVDLNIVPPQTLDIDLSVFAEVLG